MTRRMMQFAALSLVVLAASPALAQFKRSQPWRHPWGAVESRVLTCTAPNIIGRIALDDFQCEQTGPITWLRWWGVTPNGPAQRFRPYYIRIWNHTFAPCGPCGNPGAPISAIYCVQPSSKYAGTDCLGRPVWRFTATLTPPFTQQVGQHYWLQISEVESQSITAGIDFKWSAYLPVSIAPLCSAKQILAGGGYVCAITDDCPPPRPTTDLAFQLKTTCVAGTITLSPTLPLPPPSILLAEFRLPGSSDVVQSEVVEPDDDGQYALDPGLPDGNYEMTLRGMAIEPKTTTVAIMGGIAGGVDYTNLKLGDVNNNGAADGLDIAPFTQGLLMP